MKNYFLIFGINVIVMISLSCNSDSAKAQIVKGLYLDYEGGEYERTFIPCNSEEIWKVEGEDVYSQLSSIYKTSALTQYGELFIVVEGYHFPVDKSKFHSSHYSGVFQMLRIINTSVDAKSIDECRKINKKTK